LTTVIKGTKIIKVHLYVRRNNHMKRETFVKVEYTVSATTVNTFKDRLQQVQELKTSFYTDT